MGTCPDTGGEDSSQTCQAPVHRRVTPTPLETEMDDSHTLFECGSLSEPKDVAVKTEVAVAPKSDLTAAFPADAAAEMEGDWCGQQDGAVKTEMGGSHSHRKERQQVGGGEFQLFPTALSS